MKNNRKAVRERDEAREEAAHWKTEYEIVVARLCGKKHPRDNGIISEHEIIPKLTQERDEAREVASGLAAQAERLKRERDEARDRYNELLGVKKVPKWYNGREIPITAQEAAK